MSWDFFDLTAGEKEIRRQKWAALQQDPKATPSWPQVYKAELEAAARLTDLRELTVALRGVFLSERDEWAQSQPELHAAWKKQADEALSQQNPEASHIRAILIEVLTARQSFFAGNRQTTFYRGKVIVVSVASLLLSVLVLVMLVGRLLAENPVGLLDGCVLALVAGWFGGSFTWLLSNRRLMESSTLASLRELSRWPYTVSRGAIGSVCALVLFIGLTSGAVPSPVPSLFNPVVSAPEAERALQAFRAVANVAQVKAESATDDPAERAKAEKAKADELDRAIAKFSADVQRVFGTKDKPGDRSAQSDQDWLKQSGLQVKQSEIPTYGIRDALSRPGNALFFLIFVCVLAGFSETLVPDIIGSSLNKLGR